MSNKSEILIHLHYQHPLTYLSISDLYPYEMLILFVYGIIIIFSFFANFIALIIFSFGRRSRSELSPFLFNLSVFNIIMTVYCIPFTITTVIFQRWLFARELCIVLDLFKTFSVSGLLLTLITIAIDRYCAVKYPLVIKIYSAHRRNIIALLIIWLLSISLAVLWSPARSLPVEEKRLWVSSRATLKEFLDSFENDSETGRSEFLIKHLNYQLVDTIQCVPNRNQRPVEVRRSIFNSLQTYFIPLFILAFVYLRIAVMLWKRTSDGHTDLNGNLLRESFFAHESIQFKKKLKQGIKTLIAVVILHAILWLPMNVFQLCLNLLCYPNTQYQQFCSHATLLQLLYIVSHFLTVSNTAINPIVYGFTNHRFRSDIRQILNHLFDCQGRFSFSLRPGLNSRTTSYEMENRMRDSKLQKNLLPKDTQVTASDLKTIRLSSSNRLKVVESLERNRHMT